MDLPLLPPPPHTHTYLLVQDMYPQVSAGEASLSCLHFNTTAMQALVNRVTSLISWPVDVLT